MTWPGVANKFVGLFEKPTGWGVLAITGLLLLLAYCTPMFLVTGAFIYVGDKVSTDVGARFDRIERILERKEIANK